MRLIFQPAHDNIVLDLGGKTPLKPGETFDGAESLLSCPDIFRAPAEGPDTVATIASATGSTPPAQPRSGIAIPTGNATRSED